MTTKTPTDQTIVGFHAPVVSPISENSYSSELASAENAGETTDPWIGKPLQEYVVERLLGCGGMGRVYLARHRWLDMPVAIKVLHQQHDTTGEALDRFRREARLAARLGHPNIVRATDGGPIGETFYLVTEYLDGTDLNQLILDRGPLSIADASWVICEAAKGLAYAHSQGMVHRDIKPSNLMLTRQGELKLLDFGLARTIDSHSHLTATGTMMGTIDFIAPEQAADTRAVDLRSDLYSLGCTFYYLLTGHPPFDGEAYDTVVSKILAHTAEDPRPVTEYRNDLPRPVLQLLERMLAKSPSDRLQSAKEIPSILGPFAETASISGPFVANELAVDSGISSVEKSPAVTQASAIDNFADATWNALWVMVRTFLLAIGLVERQVAHSTSRLNNKTKFTYHFSPRGVPAVLSFMALGGFLFLFFGGAEILFGSAS